MLAEVAQSWDFPCTQSLQLWECSFLMRLNLWLSYLLLQQPPWNPEEHRARFTLFKTILEAGGFLALAYQLKLKLGSSFLGCTDLPVA